MNTNTIKLSFDFEPISVNKLYVNLRGQARRFLSTEGKKFKAAVGKSVLDQLTEQDVKNVSAFVGKPLTVSAVIGLPTWVLKSKKGVRKKDLDNTVKALSDSIFEALRTVNDGLDDSYIWQLTLTKKVTPEPEVTFEISEYTSPL